jgi:hypothetical protein
VSGLRPLGCGGVLIHFDVVMVSTGSVSFVAMMVSISNSYTPKPVILFYVLHSNTIYKTGLLTILNWLKHFTSLKLYIIDGIPSNIFILTCGPEDGLYRPKHVVQFYGNKDYM